MSLKGIKSIKLPQVAIETLFQMQLLRDTRMRLSAKTFQNIPKPIKNDFFITFYMQMMAFLGNVSHHNESCFIKKH